jgi:hypothetical protein
MLGEAHFNTSGTEFGECHYPWTLLASTLTYIHCLLRKEKEKPPNIVVLAACEGLENKSQDLLEDLQ